MFKKNIDSSFGINIYKELLKVWNDCKHGDGKSSFKQYLSAFHSILSSIKEKGFDPQKSLVNTTQSYKLINGGHRVAACLLYNQHIFFKLGGDGQTDVNYEYFINNASSATTPF